MIRIVFICTGNVCRSPMAQYFAQKIANKSKDPNKYYIESAGISAYDGEKATETAKIAMQKYDIDLSPHKSTNVANSGIMEADYIIVMTKIHKQALIQMFPELKDKIYTLLDIAYNDDSYTDIADPWGYDIDVYDYIATQICSATEAFMEKLEVENE